MLYLFQIEFDYKINLSASIFLDQWLEHKLERGGAIIVLSLDEKLYMGDGRNSGRKKKDKFSPIYFLICKLIPLDSIRIDTKKVYIFVSLTMTPS